LEGDYDVLLAFDHLLFTFYFKRSGCCNIWILDLLKEQWFESNYQTPDYIGKDANTYVLQTEKEKQWCHIMDFRNGHHLKVSLLDLIPKDLTKVYRQHYDPLVIGYIKQNENTNLIPTIPLVLKKLIGRYFPSFI